MSRTPPAYVTPSALRLAREAVGFTLEEAAGSIGVRPEKLDEAERGDDHLTLRQAEKAARVYERPLAALFVPEPTPEEEPETQFRRLPGAPPPPWPKEMRSLARRVRRRQGSAAELYSLLDEEPPWPQLEFAFSDDPHATAATARGLLGVALAEQKSWRDPSGYRPLREWIDATEALGVVVMQDGSLEVEDMRGFASPADVPAIVVNTNDDPRARAFTVVHELGHLLRAHAGRPTGPTTETWCDDFAGTVLTPQEPFSADFRRWIGRGLLTAIDRLALDYGVTPLAAAVRVGRLQLAPREQVEDVVEAIRERSANAQRAGGGGNYYLNKVGEFGPSFIQLVFSAVDSQSLPAPVASGLLELKVNNFGKLRERVAARGRGR